MGRFFKRALLSAAIIGGAVSARAGSYVYTPVVVGPDGPFSITLAGINESDAVVGTQKVATMKKNGHGYIYSVQGFIWRNGVATPFGAPAGAVFVSSVGINRYGVVLARDTLADGTPGSFTYDPVSGAYHQLSVPGTTSLAANSISNGGNVAGTVTIGDSAVTHSFVIIKGIAAVFDPPGALSSSAGFVSADGTASGAFYVADPNVTSGYVYKDGVFTILNSPFGLPFDGTAKSFAGYVSPHGVVLGGFFDGISFQGFVYKDGVYASGPGNYNMRVLKDGSIFDVIYATNDHVCIAGRGRGACLNPPGVFTLNPTGANENGDFVGLLQAVSYNPYNVYYENFIATCPAGQSPCQ